MNFIKYYIKSIVSDIQFLDSIASYHPNRGSCIEIYNIDILDF